MSWSVRQDLLQQLRRPWASGAMLRALITGEPLFPMQLRLRRPDGRALAERFEDVRQWIRELTAEPGFQIEWTEIDHRVLGRNRVPAGVTVDVADAYRLLEVEEQVGQFCAICAATLERFPDLRDWLLKRPFVALEHAKDWDRILDVLQWFREHPRSGLYARQIDVPGVDTKFIEERRQLLTELLPGSGSLEQRSGLRYKPLMIRFRILDPALAIHGVTELAIPDDQLAKFPIPVERVFITENEINGLAFPEAPRSMVIFGLGYGVERLAQIPWLRERRVYYWGDIDTHGFHMLDRVRGIFPHVESFLMDRATLTQHRTHWGREREQYHGAMNHLTREEAHLCFDLEGVRLEQERIRFGWVQDTVARLVNETPPEPRP